VYNRFDIVPQLDRQNGRTDRQKSYINIALQNADAR